MSLIELVFSIVIFGIVVAVPSFFMQIDTNNLHAIKQEAILSAQSTLWLILTNEWDEHSYDGSISAIVDVKDGDSQLDRLSGDIRRVGHVKADKRRKFFPNKTNASAIGYEGSVGDVDDFDGRVTTVQIPSGEGKNRLLNFSLQTNVAYLEDSATYSKNVLDDFFFSTTKTPKKTNIKMVQVRAFSDDVDVVLRAFTCNIGESETLWREF